MTNPVNNPDYSGQYAPGQSSQHPYPAAQSPASVPAHYGTAQPPAAMGLLFKERNPIITWLVFPIITLGIYVYVWYYKIHKEMAEFDRRRQAPVAGPVLVLFFLGWTVIAPLVSFYNTGQRIQNAQRASGLQPTCSPILSCLLTFVFGLNILYMQSELNKIVDRYPGAPEGAQVPLYV
ncbi:DUF4234 domain-containing protein [Dietzia aerolata]|uniref:DUF4234 domain-containing protein n=1 Tax=Dietzia aerolata TaxID=595984 RepID=A0ABV5JQ39_9ACTN|nr:DUF4234 domain-containing protein [Dietzia aerolata]